MLMGIQAYVPHGGWFIIPTMNKPLAYVLCMIIGSVIMGVLLAVLKKPLSETELNGGLDLGADVLPSGGSSSLDDIDIINL